MSAPVRSTWLTRAVWLGAAILLAVAQFRMIAFILGQTYNSSIDAANGVVHGTPHWLLYQSRVLGPYTVALLAPLFGNFSLAHVFFAITTQAIAGYLVLATVARRFGTDAAWGAFFLFQLLFTLALSKSWLYAWDHYSLIEFILFTEFVLAGKDWRWFTALFAVGIFNRESALFISLWMILQPLVDGWIERRRLPDLNWRMLGAGLATMAAGLITVHVLRSVLLVHEMGPEMFHLPELAGKSVHVKLDGNLAFLWETVSQFTLTFDILIPAFLLTVLVIALRLARHDPRRYLALALTQGAMLLSLLTVAVLQETRVLLDLIPFVALTFWALPPRESA